MTAPILQLSVRKADWQAAIRDLQKPAREKARLVLESVGVETIAFLKSHTDQRRPPVRRKGVWTGTRPAHPGGWADVTTQLVNSYRHEVVATSSGYKLILRNDAEHAVYLEARDGFFVLSGVADPGGPVEQALVEVCAVIAPEWRVSIRRGTQANVSTRGRRAT